MLEWERIWAYKQKNEGNSFSGTLENIDKRPLYHTINAGAMTIAPALKVYSNVNVAVFNVLFVTILTVMRALSGDPEVFAERNHALLVFVPEFAKDALQAFAESDGIGDGFEHGIFVVTTRQFVVGD